MALAPYTITALALPERPGVIGLAPVPGRTDLEGDVAAIRAWGAAVVVTLQPQDELEWLGIGRLGAVVVAAGLDWHHLPIFDLRAPGADFEAAWESVAPLLLERLERGDRILVHCRGGQTQIVRVLRHAAAETRGQRVAALVFVGDCMEEDIDRLCQAAGELGLLGVPAFMFHEGPDPVARKAFEEVARLTNGACCPFDAASADQLRDLLAAVAAYAAGGRRALEDFGRRRGGAAALLTHRFAGGK